VKRTGTQSNGFALMAALFLIVTFAAIGVYLLTISTGQLAAVAQDEQAARAYQAARTGIEWAAFQILKPAGTFATNTCTTLSATDTLDLGTLGAPAGAAQFHVSLTCTRTTHSEGGGAPIQVYVITATGCNNGAGTPPCPLANPGATYVERQLRLVVAN
jgi:MSHA biogenesis protein MshP